MANLVREEFLGHARTLIKRGVFYKTYGWRKSSQEVEDWVTASSNVLRNLREDGRCPVSLPPVLEELAALHPDRGTTKPTDDLIRDLVVREAIDTLVSALQEVLDEAENPRQGTPAARGAVAAQPDAGSATERRPKGSRWAKALRGDRGGEEPPDGRGKT